MKKNMKKNRIKKNKNNNNNILKQENIQSQPKSNKILNIMLVFSFRLFFISLFLTGVAAYFSNKEDMALIINIGINVVYFFGAIATFSFLLKMRMISKE